LIDGTIIFYFALKIRGDKEDKEATPLGGDEIACVQEG